MRVHPCNTNSEDEIGFVVTIPRSEWTVLKDETRHDINDRVGWGNPASRGLKTLLDAANFLERLWSS